MSRELTAEEKYSAVATFLENASEAEKKPYFDMAMANMKKFVREHGLRGATGYSIAVVRTTEDEIWLAGRLIRGEEVIQDGIPLVQFRFFAGNVDFHAANNGSVH